MNRGEMICIALIAVYIDKKICRLEMWKFHEVLFSSNTEGSIP